MRLTIEMMNGDSIVVEDQDTIARIERDMEHHQSAGHLTLQFQSDNKTYRVNYDNIAYTWR